MLSAKEQREKVTALLSQICELPAEETVDLVQIDHAAQLGSQLSEIVGTGIARAIIREELNKAKESSHSDCNLAYRFEETDDKLVGAVPSNYSTLKVGRERAKTGATSHKEKYIHQTLRGQVEMH